MSMNGEILWEQKTQRPPVQPGSLQMFYLWSTRGKLVSVQGENAVPPLIARGFLPASESELKRYKEGDYFPHYDRATQIASTLAPKAEVHNGDILDWIRL